MAPPKLAEIVAEVYGPDEAGRHEVAHGLVAAFARTPGIVGIDDSIEEKAPRAVVAIDQRKAAIAGVTPADIVATMRTALAGDDATLLRDGHSKYAVPVRIALPAEEQGRLDRLLAMTVRGTPRK